MTRLGCFLLLALASTRLIAAAREPYQDPALPQPMFQSRIDAVRVDALVTENNRPISGLQPDDFEVLDNGVRQQIDSLSHDNIPLDVVLALDTSGSVVGARLEQLRGAASRLLDHLKGDDRAGLVTFNRVVLLPSSLTRDLTGIRVALKTTSGSGETSLRDGVFTGLTLGQAAAGRALLVVFSDGVDTSSWLPAAPVLDIARRSDVVVYGISTAKGRKVPFLEEICAVTGGTLLQEEWSEGLDDTFLAILEEFRRRYVLTYSPRGVEPGGWHRLTIRVKGRDVKVKARPGYAGR